MKTAAVVIAPIVEDLLGSELPVAFRFWDGSRIGPSNSPSAVVFNSPMAFRRLAYRPNELGMGRAYVAGDIDIEGDIFEVLQARDLLAGTRGDPGVDLGARQWMQILKAALSLGAIGMPLSPPPEEARLRGSLHSRRRDAQAIAHHYDVSNDFYRLVLGETMTYSCAYFENPDYSLDQAQVAKYDLVCKKLGLDEGMRLLDVGCGWGGMIIQAARKYGANAIGITLSKKQAELAEKRVAEAGLASKVEIRIQDYRDIDDGPFDAISSIGMFEHVGLRRLSAYFGSMFRLLRPKGRFLNHAISRPSGKAAIEKNSFVGRYVFPDGELHEVGTVVSAMQAHGFEVRHVESLREHYARTLRSWVFNLENNWALAQRYAGKARARIWRLYMAGSALGFEAGRINVHQTLGVKL